ncbi:hypothetical protein LOC51_32975 [Rubrivivax sp. JA1024]|nr:hypothetical protein [Rubrivivax sp. JA1024]
MTSSQLPDNGIPKRTGSSPERQAAAELVGDAAPHPAVAETSDDHDQQTAAAALHSDDPADEQNAAKALDERDEIAKRIAAFRNLQIRLKQEREEYYERTLARARAELAPDAKPRR